VPDLPPKRRSLPQCLQRASQWTPQRCVARPHVSARQQCLTSGCPPPPSRRARCSLRRRCLRWATSRRCSASGSALTRAEANRVSSGRWVVSFQTAAGVLLAGAWICPASSPADTPLCVRWGVAEHTGPLEACVARHLSLQFAGCVHHVCPCICARCRRLLGPTMAVRQLCPATVAHLPRATCL
jgi:hypothetical protein